MTHIAAGLFFALALFGAGAIIHVTLRDYWQDILAALRGEVPARSAARPWASRPRVTVRTRPATVQAAMPQRAAS